MSSSSSGATGAAAGATGGTSTATTTTNASSTTEEAKVVIPDTTASTLTTDVYGLFIGAFFIVLSLVVLFATGSILSVLVLWALVALVVTVMIYYGFVSIDQLIGTPTKDAKKVAKEVAKPIARAAGGPLQGSEVFHVADQQFTYDEAPAVCAAYGTELATLEQVMDAFAAGAEWCGYGWSAGGMALYPTQRETWERLQGEVDNGKRTRCGRPGVNGGYFDPNLKFGVNCYGIKPPGKFDPPAPVPGVDSERFNGMVNRFKNMIKVLTLNPYSRQEWSEYDDSRPNPPVKEKFTGVGGLFDMFKQDFFTPYGVREHLEGGSSDYVEPVGETGLGRGASSLRAPYGLRGSDGDIGPTGPTGPQGIDGIAGQQGVAGPAGIAGDLGPTGPQGVKGETGPQGVPGTAGSTVGVVGEKGPTGPTGAKGDKGDKGDLGPTGKDGINGKNGKDGTNGKDASIPANGMKVNDITVGDWRLSANNQGGNPVLEFTNTSKNHKAAQIFSVGDEGVVRATRLNAHLTNYRDTWSG